MTSTTRFKFLNRLLLTLLVFCSTGIQSQSVARDVAPTGAVEAERLNPGHFDLPMRIPPLLSGSFAELRNNHLHSGIDFKTGLRVGIPVYAPADGWISRIRVSAYGFGYALYADHPNGFTTVYGHLKGYAPRIDSIVKEMHYQVERFELDTLLTPGLIPIKRGELIAFSGNSGISGGPHLHFEIRDTKTEETLDPMLWFAGRIPDNKAPEIQRLAFYASEGAGSLGNGRQSIVMNIRKDKKGNRFLVGTPPAVWGTIGIGLTAYDYMDGVSNLFGICNIRLFCDDTLVFYQDLSRFNFDQTRAVNSLTDHERWIDSRMWIMKSFVEPGNNLGVYPTLKNQGLIEIDREKDYAFRYELTDRSGNTTRFAFTLRGKPLPVQKVEHGGNRMIFWIPNRYSNGDLMLDIPAGTFYKTIDFRYEQTPDTGFSSVHRFHPAATALHQPIFSRFRVQNDVLTNKRQYYLGKQLKNGRYQWIKSSYENGWVKASLKEFGTYRILADTIPPRIDVSTLENIQKKGEIRIRIGDNVSGIGSYRCTIDGRWALATFDAKSGWLSYKPDASRIGTGRHHVLRLTVVDGCGNENQTEQTFAF